ncbi:ABC transporter substrate-binding protein [Azospirillum brasilense]|nr:ABC transporter substrate-binding protein [Azospirillum brasilense]NUB29921.1 ABC transporter substrate-binding protein [Azospirillum brasilense]RIW05433.1 ABC transporter substrate-binding protein [Azospirillum brasilense]
MMRLARPALLLLAFLGLSAFDAVETPMLENAVGAGSLPPVEKRLPLTPLVEPMDRAWQSPGRHGGDLRLLMARTKDTRLIYVYSYARLVGLTPDLRIVPDILERVDVEDGRIFTFTLRRGHRWSDGHPFTAEDFRYWWEDMANNAKRSPGGPPPEMMVAGEAPKFEVLDAAAVRYTWTRPNPFFLPMLAGAKPVEIYAPAHYLRRFHPRFTEPLELKQRVEAERQKSWQQLHNRKDNLTEFDNPDLPTLQPWVPTTAPPAERFIFVRNPYFHRVDPAGRQLPYIDRLIMTVADAKIIPAKTGAGESDLQARYLRFDNYTFLKQGAKRNDYRVTLWRTGIGAQMALFPNLNCNDPVWRALNRDVRYRRALSLAIDREEMNQVIYYGLAIPSNNTLLEVSPLWVPAYRDRWAQFDVKQANRLLDEVGLTKRDVNGVRLLPDGRPLEIVVETAGESTEETDALELIADGWRRIGARLYIRSSQLDVFRNRIFAGDTCMSISRGLDNAIATADMSPAELVPVDQAKYQWPKWGQFFQTMGKDGERPDMPEARDLLEAFRAWRDAPDEAGRAAAWTRILTLNTDQVFTIGTVAGVPQPVVARRTLRNVPEEGLFNYDPGAHFGLYRPDGFWFDRKG